ISLGGGRSDDPAGHVAVVIKVSVTKSGHGYITIINENASATGITHITVVDGKLTFTHGYYTAFEWLTGLPTS
ncbi:MAG: hypothetical protein ACRDXC_12450, partial [Acidimicrobiales bacterium]